MLTPEELQKIPDYFVDLYQDLEQFVIKDFARRVRKAGEITDTAKWQAMRGQEVGMALSKLKKEIKTVTGLVDEEIQGLFVDVAEVSLQNDAPIYKQKGKLVPNLENSERLQSYVQAAQEQTKGELFNMTQSLGFARKVGGKIEYLPMFEFYNKALDMAQFQVSTGVLDYQTATRNAVKAISQSGLRWIDYESGWHNRVDVAARRAIMTGVNQMSSQFNDQVIEDLGADYVEVTAHAGARPSHSSWQGKVFKINGSSRGYPNLAETTGLGTGPGLCGWNCRHNYYAFFPKISVRSYSDKELDNIDPPPFEYEGKNYTHYEATQKQRQIETAMRQSKNELIGYDALDDKEAFTMTSIKLTRQKEFYKDFSNAANLRYQNDRHQVLGFDRSISQKSVWANKKGLKKLEEKRRDDIINVSDIQIGKSLGAAAFKDAVKLPNGDYAKLVEGSKITKVVIFAGKGTKKPVKVAKYLSEQYKIPEKEWKKVRGEGLVDLNNKPTRAELHWFEAEKVGRIKMKVKRWFD